MLCEKKKNLGGKPCGVIWLIISFFFTFVNYCDSSVSCFVMAVSLLVVTVTNRAIKA